jgi:type IV secretory pathway VirB10-like protein
MNDIDLSASARRLLASAKGDLPSVAARAKMWAGVSCAVGGAAAGAGALSASSTALSGGAGAAKVLFVGAMFGGSVAVGLATALLQVGPLQPPSASTRSIAPPRVEAARWNGLPAPSPAREKDAPTTAPPAPVDDATAAAPQRALGGAGSHVPARRQPRPPAREDALAREASLVGEARSALGRGDPRSALAAIRAARGLSSKQLVPEELAVEEQALRALGRSDQANEIDVMLRLEYPESALAR